VQLEIRYSIWTLSGCQTKDKQVKNGFLDLDFGLFLDVMFSQAATVNTGSQ